jgi:hypothetical protein
MRILKIKKLDLDVVLILINSKIKIINSFEIITNILKKIKWKKKIKKLELF